MSYESVLLFAALYSLGGRTEVPLWVRRVLAPGLLLGSYVISSWHPSFRFFLSCIVFLPLFIGLRVGYGVNDENFSKKLFKRALAGLLCGCSGLLLGIYCGSLSLGCLQFAMAITGSVFLGAINPFKAWVEEFLIALSFVCFIPFF